MAKPKTSNKQKRKKGKKFRFFAEQVKQDANDQGRYLNLIFFRWKSIRISF